MRRVCTSATLLVSIRRSIQHKTMRLLLVAIIAGLLGGPAARAAGPER